jgi:hypothetical protein
LSNVTRATLRLSVPVGKSGLSAIGELTDPSPGAVLFLSGDSPESPPGDVDVWGSIDWDVTNNRVVWTSRPAWAATSGLAPSGAIRTVVPKSRLSGTIFRSTSPGRFSLDWKLLTSWSESNVPVTTNCPAGAATPGAF